MDETKQPLHIPASRNTLGNTKAHEWGRNTNSDVAADLRSCAIRRFVHVTAADLATRRRCW
ncbi:rCG47094, partial [Rattus norvegicus]